MSERCYYKVEDVDSDLFKKASEFLDMEEEFINTQKQTVEKKVPKFSYYKCRRGFERIVRYIGFVFDDQENIDKKVWKTKEVDGKMLSVPNTRTKAGKEMKEFLGSFKRTTCWDVERLLSIDKKSIYGEFYPADLFKNNGVVYIFIDSQYRDIFEQENVGFKEITYGEMEKAIDEYNEK